MKKRIRMKKLKNQERKCTLCDGEGAYEDFFDDMYGGTHTLGVFECTACEGTGKVNLLADFKSDVRVNKFMKKNTKDGKKYDNQNSYN